MPATRDLMASALALPEKERLKLVEALLSSLTPSAEEMSNEELKSELDRRWTEHEANPAAALSCEAVKKRARKKSN